MRAIYLGNQQINAAALGSIPVSSITLETIPVPPPPTPPTASLVFWFDGREYVSSSSAWYSNNNLPYTASSVGALPLQKRSDNGGIVNFTTASAITIDGAGGMNYTTKDFTLFVATRYSGSATDIHGRLFSSVNVNWLMPTYGGGPGGGSTEYHSAYFDRNTFIILSGSIYDTEWRISTVVRDRPNASSSFYVNGVLAASGSNNTAADGFFGLSINAGAFQGGTTNPAGGEVTQADVGDILLYDSVLNQSQINTVYDILKVRYGLS